MNVQLAKMYGILVGALALLGLFVSGHLFGLMNTDIALDLVRVALAAFLLYAGFVSKERGVVNAALLTVGIAYVGMGLIGFFAPTLGGLLPSGLTGFDNIFHLVTGLVAVVAGMSKEKSTASATAH